MKNLENIEEGDIDQKLDFDKEDIVIASKYPQSKNVDDISQRWADNVPPKNGEKLQK
jgi:hypothetical protein